MRLTLVVILIGLALAGGARSYMCRQANGDYMEWPARVEWVPNELP